MLSLEGTRENIRKKISRNYKIIYQNMPQLYANIIDNNPHSITMWGKHEVAKIFECLYLSYKCCIDGLIEQCWPIISLHGCHLKGKCRDVCLAIVGLEGDTGIYITICIRRKDDLANLGRVSPCNGASFEKTPQRLTIMSNIKKNLDAIVVRVFLEHNTCVIPINFVPCFSLRFDESCSHLGGALVVLVMK